MCTVTFGEKKVKDISIRLATIDDAESILNIYGPYVQNTAISFEYKTPTLEEFQTRIANISKNYPYLVAEQNNRIIGYAYGSRFHERAAFSWCAEVSIYVDANTRKCGVGRALYEALEKALKKQGILNLYASIAYTDIEDEYLNKNSAQFHAHLGYEQIGRFHKCGYKFNRWYDMIWMEKFIGEHETTS